MPKSSKKSAPNASPLINFNGRRQYRVNLNTAEKYVIGLYRGLTPPQKHLVDATLGLALRQPADRFALAMDTIDVGHTSSWWLVYFNSTCQAVFGRPTGGAK